MEEKINKLIVGLGNPGIKYEMTRHNLGFLVLDELAKDQKIEFKKVERFEAELAKLETDTGTVFLLKPQTFMNLSGRSVRKCIDFYKIKVNHILVVVDDAYLEFGESKIKPKGGSAGHQGLKNIEGHIGQNYARLKMGIGEPKRGLLESYVLEKFNAKEVAELGHFVDQGVDAVKQWLDLGLEKTMNQINTKTH